MAATVGEGRTTEMTPYFKREFRISTLEAGVSFSITHGGPSSYKARAYSVNVKTLPTAPCLFNVIRDKDNETSTTAVFKLMVETGGDPSGLVLDIELMWDDAKSGGIS